MGNPIYEDSDTGPFFEGFTDRGCGEHHTVGPHRAWCFDCGEWCYPDVPCGGCERGTDAKVVPDATNRVNSVEGVSAAEAWREGYVAGQVDMDAWTRSEYGYTKNPYEEGLQ